MERVRREVPHRHGGIFVRAHEVADIHQRAEVFVRHAVDNGLHTGAVLAEIAVVLDTGAHALCFCVNGYFFIPAHERRQSVMEAALASRFSRVTAGGVVPHHGHAEHGRDIHLSLEALDLGVGVIKQIRADAVSGDLNAGFFRFVSQKRGVFRLLHAGGGMDLGELDGVEPHFGGQRDQLRLGFLSGVRKAGITVRAYGKLHISNLTFRFQSLNSNGRRTDNCRMPPARSTCPA